MRTLSQNATLTLITLIGTALLQGSARADHLTETPPAPPVGPPVPIVIEDSWPDPLAPVCDEEWPEEEWVEEGAEEIVCGAGTPVQVHDVPVLAGLPGLPLPGLIDIDIDFGSILLGLPPLFDIDAVLLGTPGCAPVFAPVWPPIPGPVFVPDFDPFYNPGIVYGTPVYGPSVYGPSTFGPSTFGPTLVAGDDIGDHFGDEIEITQNVTNINKTRNVFNNNSLTDHSVHNGAADRDRGSRIATAPSAGKKRAARKSNRTSRDRKGGKGRKSASSKRAPSRAKNKSSARKKASAKRRPTTQRKAQKPARRKASTNTRRPATQRKAQRSAHRKASTNTRRPATQRKAQRPARRKASNNRGFSRSKSPSARKRRSGSSGFSKKNRKNKRKN